MSEKVGTLSFGQREEGGLKPYSDETAELIDTEVYGVLIYVNTRFKRLLIVHMKEQ